MEDIKPVTILLVEDDPGDQKLTKKFLSEARIINEAVIAGCGEEGLDYLERCRGADSEYLRPDLILLDLNMPGMGGKEFLKRVKNDEDFCMIPIVILTTSDLVQDVRDSYKLQASGYIKKPVTLQGFQEMMENLQEYWFSICKLA